MGKQTRHYCDLCGQSFYHQIYSIEFMPAERTWWWNGTVVNSSDYEICRECSDVIQYLVLTRKDMVQRIRAQLNSVSPARQMRDKPRPLTMQWVARHVSKLLTKEHDTNNDN